MTAPQMLRGFATEERLREAQRKLDETRKQHDAERKRLLTLLQQEEEELDRQALTQEILSDSGGGGGGGNRLVLSEPDSVSTSQPPTAIIGNLRAGTAKPPASCAFNTNSTAGSPSSAIAALVSPRGDMVVKPLPPTPNTASNHFPVSSLANLSPRGPNKGSGPGGGPKRTEASAPTLVASNSAVSLIASSRSTGSGTSGGNSPSGNNVSSVASLAPIAAQLTDTELREILSKRGHVVNEIVSTECAHIDDLTIWIEEYMKPLANQQLLSKDDLNVIFSNIDQLVPINVELYQQMRDALQQCSDAADTQLGELFLKHAELFKIYTLYFTNNAIATQTLDRLVLENRLLNEFLELQQFRNARTRGLTFPMFMIKPIQRLCKYPLLLRELVKCTPDTHPDHGPLLRAYEKMENTVTFLNEKKRDREALQRVVDVCKSIEGPQFDESTFILPTRRYMMEAQLNLILGLNQSSQRNMRLKRRHAFLFNDLLLLTKLKPSSNSGPLRYLFKAQFALSNARVIDIADRDGFCYVFGLAPKDNMDPNAQTSLQCSSPEEKERWLTTLKRIAKEFQLKAITVNRTAALTAAGGLSSTSLPRNVPS